MTPELSIGTQASNDTVVTGFVLGTDIELNSTYLLEGVPYPHPATQKACVLIGTAEEEADNLDTFEPSEQDMTDLKIFQPNAWTYEDLVKKLNKVYRDLEQNVTHIYKRRELHLALDLTYHSALSIDFAGKRINGWVNALVAGDSSQGKSEASIKLMEHYGLGERVDCKNASTAGLIGGLQQMGVRWFVSWELFLSMTDD